MNAPSIPLPSLNSSATEGAPSNGNGHYTPPPGGPNGSAGQFVGETSPTHPTEQDRGVMAQYDNKGEVEDYAAHRFSELHTAEREIAAATENAAIRDAQLQNLTFDVHFQRLKGLDSITVGTKLALPRGVNFLVASLLVFVLLSAITAEVNNQRVYALQDLQDPLAALSIAIIAVFIAVFWHLSGRTTASEKARQCVRWFVNGIGTIAAFGYVVDLALLFGPARKPFGLTPDVLRTGLLLLQSLFVPCLCSVIMDVLAKFFPTVKQVDTDPEHEARSAAAKSGAAEIARAEQIIAHARTITLPYEDRKATTMARFTAVWAADKEAANAETRKMNVLLGRGR
jgi:hypothetical protein